MEKILRVELEECDLPDFYYEYMVGMIKEEPPRDALELEELLGEVVKNGGIEQSQARLKCQNIFEQLKTQKMIEIQNTNKLSHAAEKLEKAVILNELDILEGNDMNQGYEDAFLGTEVFKMDDDTNYKEQSQKLIKKKQQDDKKQQQMYEKHLFEMKKNRERLPRPVIDRKIRENQQSRDILIEKLTLIIGGRALLEDAKIQMSWGRKYGLIGRNGIGKTCLLAALARGEFGGFQGLQVLLVEQEIHGEDLTAVEILLEADIERHELLKKEDHIIQLQNENRSNELLDAELVEIQNKLIEIDASKQPSRAQSILSGLGFTNELMNIKTKYLSGGWKMRVNIARALFVEPDILFLDEPTNHLDLDAVMWLEDYLSNCQHTVIVVSHAREFLNIVCTDIIHFKDNKLEYYRGNYDGFEQVKNNKLKNQKRQLEAQNMKVQHMKSFIDKFRYNAKRASLVQSRIKALNKMEMLEDIIEDPTCIFQFPTPEKLRPPLLKIDDGSFGYSYEHVLLKGLNFGVDMESRVAIVGSNGVGKSTFLKLLSDDLSLHEGFQYRNPKLRISLFTQHHMESLNLMLSPLEQFSETYSGVSMESIRSHLSSFGITGNLQLRPMYLLSGGQKSRVAFALCVWTNPHIMILDEPTNHLDLDAVNALIVALNNFQGGVLIVSHDQHLIASTCDYIWYIKEQRLRKFNGDFEDYRKALASNRL